MTVIFLAEYNTKCFAVTFQNIGSVKVQKSEDISNDKNKILCGRPLRTFLSKSEVCGMTLT